MARLAGMTLRERWSNWNREPFTSDSPSHVSVSTGHAVEDAAAAALVYREAIRRGIGTAVDL